MERMKQGNPIEAKMNRLIVLTGARATGKTTLAAEHERPSQIGNVAYFDSEKSANNFRSRLKEKNLGDFGLYVDLQERWADLKPDEDLLDRINKGKPPWVDKKDQNAFIGYYQYVLQKLVELPRNKFTTVVLDTAEKFEAGMAAYVEQHQSEFGITSKAYGKLWTDGIFLLYENLLQGLYSRGVENVILTLHLRNVWEGSRMIPGKVNMSGKKVLYRLSSLMLWLVNDSRNPNGEPAALVVKERTGDVGVTEDDEWDNRRKLPPRIPTCTWTHIRRYLRDGYDVANPDEREKMSAAELEMIEPLMLSDAQMKLMLAEIGLQQREKELEMAQAGIVMNVPDAMTVTEFTSSPTSPNGSLTKAEAIAKWKEMEKPLPLLMKKMREMGIEDTLSEGQWREIVGE